MWTRNVDTGKWLKQTDKLSKDNYDDLKQDLQKVKLFSKCLSGSTYLPINDLGNIYSPLNVSKIGYYVNEAPLYSINFPPQGPQLPLNTTNQREFYDKYLHESAFSVKNLFTPDRLLNNQAQNIFEVDAATIEPITGIGTQIPNLVIDGVKLVEGNRVLIKDQISEIELSIATDVEDYFTNTEKVASYLEIEDNITSKRYRYTNSENGIYKYTNRVLVRESDLDTYNTAYRYCVTVRSGNTNREKQFHLSRLKDGYFPVTSENQNLEFLEKTSWILRNRVDYNNQFDLNLQQSLYHATQSFFDAVDGKTYSIPERLISVGEFGAILNNQDKLSSSATFSNTSIMFNKWKVFLRSIDQTEKFYWICGNEGTLLGVDKVSFEMIRIDLGEVNNLLSISFYGNLNGMVVGEFNSVYYTTDGGYNWSKIDFPNFDLFSYNKVIHFGLTKAFVVGNNGLFLEMEYITGEWTATKRKISKFLEPDGEYILVDDLRDAEAVKLIASNPATYSFSESSIDFYDSLIYKTSVNSEDQIYIELDSKYFGTNIEYGIGGTPLKFRVSLEITGSVSGLIYSGSNFNYILPAPVPAVQTWDMYVDTGLVKKTFTYSLPLDNEGNVIDQELTISSNVIYNYNGTNFTIGWYQGGINVDYNYDLVNSDFICMVGNNERFIVYDINSRLPSYNPFIYFSFSQSHSDIVSVSKSKNSNRVFIAGDKIYKINLGDIRSVTAEKNWVNSTSQPWGDFFVNDISTNENNLFITGNGTLVKKGDYATVSYQDVDPTLLSGLKSRLLFLDYDMASKLNFFTDLGEYRLPQSVTFSFTNTTSPLTLNSLPNEFSFIDYYKDAEKTFKYFTSFQDINVVKFSTTFTQSNTIATFSFVGSQISTSLGDILPLAPNIDSEGASRFISNGSITTNYTTSFRALIYKYMIIFVDMRNVSVGDVLRMTSSVIDLNLVINRIESIALVTNPFGFGQPPKNYVYCYTEFNDNIIRNLKNSTSTINVVNLNKYLNVDQLVSKFEIHPISLGYKLEKVDNLLQLTPRFNNKTAYYNLQSRVVLGSQSKDLLYEDSFLNFGYSPTYNIQDYLYKIEPTIFDQNIKFSILPEYNLLPGNAGNSATSSNIYIDPVVGVVNTGTVSYYRNGTNTIIFGDDYRFHWESLLIHTFVDMDLYHTNGVDVYTSEKFLIIKKYYDEATGGWAMDFHKKIEIPSAATIASFTIRSRNTLSQISSDLQLLNNVQRTQLTKSIQTNYTFTNLENELRYKFPTDSYMKVLVSDWRVKKYLTGIIYTDYEYNIALNILQVGENKTYQISDTSQQNAAGFTNRLKLNFNSSHEVEIGDLVYLEFNGGSQSSEFLNTQYFGYHRVLDVFSTVGGGWVVVNEPYGQTPLSNSDSGILSFYKVDPFFNYQPIDLFRVGVDKKVTRSVEIKPDNFQVVGATWSLINLDLNKFKLRFVDGLYLDEVSQKYHWLLEAEVSNAVIGRSNNGIIWYSGDWLCGRWFGGTWMSGRWVSGDWYGGTWNSFQTQDKIIKIDVDTSTSNLRSSRWFGGRWFDGVWNNGSWFNGRKYAGLWIDGVWYDGIWNDGTWQSGQFQGGVWVLGKWESGTMNSNSKPLYWLDGEFKSGDFENGIWYNGKFGNDRKDLARFGTRSTNTRPSIWNGGTWLSGEFHSLLNTDSETGLPTVSDIHKYSVWRTGNWLGGDFWGGIAYNINFRGGIWHGGILEEIQVIGVNAILPATQSTNSIVLNGVFRFNIGDEIWIIDDYRDTPYSPLGSNTTPRKYRINFMQEDEILNRTTLRLNYNLSTLGVTASYASQSLIGYETGLRVVSYFKDSIWESGLWTNGIFENGSINSVIWYNGVFVSGNWGN